MRRLYRAARRIGRVTSAFVWLGATETIAYPLQLILSNVFGPALVPVLYSFVAQLVDDTDAVGNDYYTFVIIGFVTMNVMELSLRSFSGALNSAIQQGRFETFLIQPVSWYALPFALAAWPITLACFNAMVMALIAFGLGFRIDPAGLPLALVVLLLGVLSSHAIGTLAASVRLLSKKADPVVVIYTLAASILSGTLFPLTLLPSFIRPLAYALPMTHAISAGRQLLMPDGHVLSGPSVATSIAVLSGITAGVYLVSMVAFGRSLDFGRRYGVIGDY